MKRALPVTRRAVLPLLAVLLCCIPAVARQQQAWPAGLEIRHLNFEGNQSFGDGTFRDLMTTRESGGWLSKFFFHTLGEKFGSGPEYYRESVFDDDQKIISDYYQSKGFYHVTVGGSVKPDSAEGTVDLLVTIDEGRRSLIDSVAYRGLDSIPNDLLKQVRSDPVQYRGIPYDNSRDGQEKSRILTLLANAGYPTAKFDPEASGAYRLTSTDNFILVFSFNTGRRYEFDSVRIRIDPPRPDITDQLVLRQLDFAPGDLYSLDKKISSERNLNRLGLFESAIINRRPGWDSSSSSRIPMDISLRARARNELAPEVLVSDENNGFTTGLGLGYTARNFIGDARTLTARAQARTQSLVDLVFNGRNWRDPAVIGTLELDFQLAQPVVFSRTLSGSWTLTMSAEKQTNIILSILRNKFGFSKQYAPYTFGFFEWALERVNPEILPGDTVQLQVEDRPQFNSILTVTLQHDRTNDIFSPTGGFFHSISLEESGLLPKILSRSRDSSSLPFTQYYKATLLGRWYLDLSKNRFNILAMKMKTGYQNKYGESRSLPVQIPLNRRFFAGGSGSVRGWKARDLGAMQPELIQFGGNFLVEGSVEMRVNHFRGFGRTGWIRWDNIWGVYFLDFGNVWTDINDFKPRDVAVAAGIGIRYDTFFGPFRIDYGIRVYDPNAPVGSMTIFKHRFWGETMRNGVIQFGIGQAF